MGIEISNGAVTIGRGIILGDVPIYPITIIETFSVVGNTTWVAPANVTGSANVLIVGAGASGSGGSAGGGGGGGQVQEGSWISLAGNSIAPGQTFTMHVGANAAYGGNSYISTGATKVESLGGGNVFGGPAVWSSAGQGAFIITPAQSFDQINSGVGTKGGDGYGSPTVARGGGGGSAAGNGGGGSAGGIGGVGILSSLSGTPVTYGVGGGGSGTTGGGSRAGTPGSGGAGAWDSGAATAGSNGIIVIAYQAYQY